MLAVDGERQLVPDVYEGQHEEDTKAQPDVDCLQRYHCCKSATCVDYTAEREITALIILFRSSDAARRQLPWQLSDALVMMPSFPAAVIKYAKAAIDFSGIVGVFE